MLVCWFLRKKAAFMRFDHEDWKWTRNLNPLDRESLIANLTWLFRVPTGGLVSCMIGLLSETRDVVGWYCCMFDSCCLSAIAMVESTSPIGAACGGLSSWGSAGILLVVDAVVEVPTLMVIADICCALADGEVPLAGKLPLATVDSASSMLGPSDMLSLAGKTEGTDNSINKDSKLTALRPWNGIPFAGYSKEGQVLPLSVWSICGVCIMISASRESPSGLKSIKLPELLRLCSAGFLSMEHWSLEDAIFCKEENWRIRAYWLNLPQYAD